MLIVRESFVDLPCFAQLPKEGFYEGTVFWMWILCTLLSSHDKIFPWFIFIFNCQSLLKEDVTVIHQVIIWLSHFWQTSVNIYLFAAKPNLSNRCQLNLASILAKPKNEICDTCLQVRPRFMLPSYCLKLKQRFLQVIIKPFNPAEVWEHDN